MSTPSETLSALVEMPEYTAISEGMSALRVEFFDTPIFAHIDALAKIMPRLASAIASMAPKMVDEPGDDETTE